MPGDPSGEVLTKKKADEMFRADSSTRYLNLDYEDVKMRFYGSTAVVTTRESLRWESAGKVDSASYRLTAVFVKQNADWRCAASHSSPIDKKK